ncbi:MAG: cellulase family glycosylhydrolase [Myxococcales bacterium]|nr:cellulase family glycosylhydrolase [Myxococcales bacterium]
MRTSVSRQLLSLSALAGVAACGNGAPAPVDMPGADLAIHADGEYLRDREGRVVILRGMNYAGMEFGNFVGAPNGPAAEDFAQMASWGVNAVRVAISWQYLEPEPGVFDENYLIDNLDPVIAWAAANDILVIPEMHQFYTSPCFGDTNEPPQWSGIGFPSWTCEGQYTPEEHFKAMCEFFAGKLAPDGRTLIEHFTDAWRLVATHYAGDLRIGGFDLFNEPMCVGNLRDFQRDHLNPVLRDVREALRGAGAEHTFFYSPVVTRNLGFGVEPESMGQNVVYAPHLYTQTGGLPTSKYGGNIDLITADYEQARLEAAVMGAPFIAAEFGGSTQPEDGFLAATTAFLADSQRVQDDFLVGGLWWAFFPGDNIFSLVDAAGTPKGELAATLARPYAQRIAGAPTAMAYDHDASQFSLTYDTRLPGLRSAPTQLYVPPAWFDAGFDVSLTDGATYESLPGSLRVHVTTALAGEVTVILQRRAARGP